MSVADPRPRLAPPATNHLREKNRCVKAQGGCAHSSRWRFLIRTDGAAGGNSFPIADRIQPTVSTDLLCSG
jgi:hypothetical protein